MKNFLFLVYNLFLFLYFLKRFYFLYVIFSDRRKSISINSDLFDITGVLDEHCVISGFMGVSNMLNLVAAAASDNNFGVVGGNICDEADEIGGDTSSSASVSTA